MSAPRWEPVEQRCKNEYHQYSHEECWKENVVKELVTQNESMVDPRFRDIRIPSKIPITMEITVEAPSRSSVF